MTHAFHTVADQLPFHIDDTPQVNAAFLRWHQHQTPGDKRIVDLWTYCYIYRYFTMKFAPSDQDTPLCFDRLIAGAFADVQEHIHSIRRPERYTAWVGTLCKNTFINHLRTRRSTLSLDADTATLLVEPPPPAVTGTYDAVLIQQTVCTAIDALPPFLSTVARMRLLENRSYEAISEATGKPLPTLRTYVNRALKQLRKNPALQELLAEICD
ncbi:MAG TPA: sigma-70 family RNA polymerase sigma factor [Rhodothermales bacterium]|nr:sigma-70 family RNA polymerase sigma factor [Rhodothermales bacterium]